MKKLLLTSLLALSMFGSAQAGQLVFDFGTSAPAPKYVKFSFGSKIYYDREADVRRFHPSVSTVYAFLACSRYKIWTTKAGYVKASDWLSKPGKYVIGMRELNSPEYFCVQNVPVR
ncbi:hypothetical protein [uncultured Cohaesibacter sp.]|uniref:hypothetical protein n=1 Tax=uncultured Cohaesibacter sp. TaxID=1002546 RepID=UPI0029303B1A|nr:hypothetical protein [uncultured Cohaesibacter sp.]